MSKIKVLAIFLAGALCYAGVSAITTNLPEPVTEVVGKQESKAPYVVTSQTATIIEGIENGEQSGSLYEVLKLVCVI
ncbi:MAG TPA: hypothetical protein VJJ22_04465 [Candidatus Paceibacterota bacterium]